MPSPSVHHSQATSGRQTGPCHAIVNDFSVPFDQLKYRFWDRVGTVVELIERWQPPAKSHSMSQYEQSLCGFLQRNLPDVRITTRSGHDSDTARIALSPNLLIEFRANLNTIDECQRLLSELPAMIKASKAFVVIVFTGNVDIALIKSLRRRLREWSADLVSH
jgi:hypothetical protein